MIVEKIFEFLLNIVSFLITLLPDALFLNLSTTGLSDFFGYGVWLVTPEVFLLIFGNVLFWTTVHFTWGFISWVWNSIH